MYKTGHAACVPQQDVELHEHLISVWCELDQSVVLVNHAIDEWGRCLSAYVDAEGRHFER